MIVVSVIIVNYNTHEWLGLCLASIFHCSSNIELEIIVVDNNSPNRDFESVLAQYPLVNIIQLDKNIGFGSACNVAARTAQGEFLFFLNPDVVLHNNAIRLFYDFWTSNNRKLNIACLGAFLQDNNAKPIHSFGTFPVMKKLILNKIKSTFKISIKQKVGSLINSLGYQKVEYITGANLFISAQKFALVGGFDERFFMYFEETDLQYRLFQKGYFSYLISQPKIEHFQGASTQNQNTLLRVLYFDSLLVYFQKHSSTLAFSIFRMFWYCLDFKTYLQKRTIHKVNKIV